MTGGRWVHREPKRATHTCPAPRPRLWRVIRIGDRWQCRTCDRIHAWDGRTWQPWTQPNPAKETTWQ